MSLQERLGEWYPYLKSEFTKPRTSAVKKIYAEDKADGLTTVPHKDKRFAAYQLSDPKDVHTVLLGDGVLRNGYGLAFSSDGGWHAEQLKIALEECLEPTGQTMKESLWEPSLDGWPQKGVMPLSTGLTAGYAKGKRRSHAPVWSWLIRATIKVLVEQDRPIVFILMDKTALDFLDDIQVSEKRVALKTGDIYEAFKEKEPWAHKFCFFASLHFLGSHRVEHLGFDSLPF